MSRAGRYLMEITLGLLLNKIWVILAGWFWYDKRRVDDRLKEVEKVTASNHTDIRLIEVKLDNIHTLLEVKFGAIKEDMVEIKGKIK